ncbi:MAG TPA: hypothetical protein DEP18_02075 [Flavobacteriales bacterium]|nr:hypothetical protein [Flavobacteriales bacterium]HCA82544.1 hypothetical protein [Flavobacteriales bacterium]HRE75759.1 outer membrane beta-barrel protein [Flavobacteriales bacterium]HRE96803.1 outer membrane beta-barrel protein [Flavobacteriales bacterium]HRJ35427.1 outer membrane beta-barrel protein [Flavobacteriales bacterium]
MRGILVFVFLLNTPIAFCQISAEEAYKGIIPGEYNSPERMHRWMMDVYQDRWEPLPNGIQSKWYSFGIAASRMIDIPLNKRSTIAFAFGPGIGSHNVHHNGAFTNTIDTSGIRRYRIEPLPTGYSYKRNKIRLTLIELPFQLRIRSKRDGFFFYPGFKAGWLVGNHSLIVDDQGKYKRYNYKGFEKLQYGPTLHMGYNRLALYAYYSLTPVMKEGEDFRTFSIGLSLNFF